MKTGFLCASVLALSLPVIAPAAEETAAAKETGSKVSSVRGVEINELIERVAKRTGRQFIVDPRVRGEVPLTGFDLDRLDYDKLLAVLSVNQYAVYSSAGSLVVAPDASSRQFPTAVTTAVPAKALDNEMVSLVHEVKQACAAHLVPVLRPLMPQSAHLAAMPPNILLVVDRAANARRIVEMADRIDRAAPQAERCGAVSSYPASAPKADSK
jgi:general secretion pathway protein D